MIKINKTPSADTRTATEPISQDVLLANSLEHIRHVAMGLQFFADMLEKTAVKHDWTKIQYIDSFAKDAATGKFGAEFKALPWFQLHVNTERHHVLDNCPEDVNLIDLLERIVDITMAGLSRSGTIYDDEIPIEILVRAYKNTLELLKAHIEVIDE